MPGEFPVSVHDKCLHPGAAQFLGGLEQVFIQLIQFGMTESTT
jgi:hypothetical protein